MGVGSAERAFTQKEFVNIKRKSTLNRQIVRIGNQARIIRKLGLKHYLRYRTAPKNTKLFMPINGRQILVRKGTPDLNVALSCLGGEFKILKDILPDDYDGIIVDAGGYIGTATLALNDLFPKSKIIVIEPSRENIEVLKVNLSQLTNVKIVYGALVGKETGNVTLKNRGTGEWGFTVVDKPNGKNNAEVLHNAPAFTLHQLGVSPSDIGILKLDIEGGEFDILTNDVESLNEIHAVFAELHDRIVAGCTEMFTKFSKDRALIKDKGEKYLSVKKQTTAAPDRGRG